MKKILATSLLAIGCSSLFQNSLNNNFKVYQKCDNPGKWIQNNNRLQLNNECINFALIIECSSYNKELIITSFYEEDNIEIFLNNKSFKFSYTGGPAGRLLLHFDHLNGQNLNQASNNFLDDMKKMSKNKFIDIKVKTNNKLFSFKADNVKNSLNEFFTNSECNDI